MKVKRLPKDPGPSGWAEILPPAPAPLPLQGDHRADWLIIGAGFTGLAAARRLMQTRPDDRIMVLDAVRLGEGPAGRNSGFMIDLPHDLASDNYAGALDKDRAQIAVNRAAIDFALDMAREFGLPEEAIRQTGKINGAASARGMAHISDYSGHLSRLGEPYEIYDAATMRNITGTDYYQGGLFTPHAALLQPALFVRGIAEGLRSRSIAVHDSSPVYAMTRGPDGWRVATPKGNVNAPKVILAVNGHAESFGFFRRHLAHVFTYGSMTRPLTAEEVTRLGGRADWALTPADPMGTTVRRISGTGGDRIVVRNRFTYDPSMEVDAARIASVGKVHDTSFRARFPMLDGVEMAYRWGGRLCISRNDTAAFGEVGEGLFAACCQNGLGVAKGTVSGIAAADLATGQSSPFVDYQTGLPAPSRLPPEPISWLGATAKIKWAERAAGREL